MNAAESLYRSLCFTIAKSVDDVTETQASRSFLQAVWVVVTADRRHDVILRAALAGRNTTNRNDLPHIARSALR